MEESDAKKRTDEINLKMAEAKALGGAGCALIAMPFLLLMLVVSVLLMVAAFGALFH